MPSFDKQPFSAQDSEVPSDIFNLSPFPIAVAGDGAVFRGFTRLFCRPDFTEGVPNARITALLDVDRASCMGVPCLQDIPIYHTVSELFVTHPDLQMVIDLSDGNKHLTLLKQQAPASCSVLAQEGAILLQQILASDHICHSCIKELRRAQDLFSTLIDQVDEDILLLDADGTIMDMNAVALQRLGGEKREHIGKTCHELNEKGFACTNDRSSCPLKETLATGNRADRTQSRVLENGKMQYLRIYTYPVFGTDGRISHIIELRRDITNRTHMEQKLQQAEKMAAIGELATYIAHEIRNPLFAIGGFANSLLRSPKLDESLHSKAEVILAESKRLDKILKTTLNFARPTAQGTDGVDLNGITAETLQLMRLGCEKRGITANVELAEDLAMAIGNPDMLKQCLINLVKNAMEAMEQGGHLDVRTGMTQTHVFVTVQDTGHGIPAENRDNVFSPFFSTKGEGAGLGLAMTKKIIDEMGGYVELLSQENLGTTITLFLLPLPAVDESVPDMHIPVKDFSDAVICGPNGDSPTADCMKNNTAMNFSGTPSHDSNDSQAPKDSTDGSDNSTGNAE